MYIIICLQGLQHKSVDKMVEELNLPSNQVLAMFNKAVRKITVLLRGLIEDDEAQKLFGKDEKGRKKVRRNRNLSPTNKHHAAKYPPKKHASTLLPLRIFYIMHRSLIFFLCRPRPAWPR